MSAGKLRMVVFGLTAVNVPMAAHAEHWMETLGCYMDVDSVETFDGVDRNAIFTVNKMISFKQRGKCVGGDASWAIKAVDCAATPYMQNYDRIELYVYVDPNWVVATQHFKVDNSKLNIEHSNAAIACDRAGLHGPAE